MTNTIFSNATYAMKSCRIPLAVESAVPDSAIRACSEWQNCLVNHNTPNYRHNNKLNLGVLFAVLSCPWTKSSETQPCDDV